MGGHGQAAWWPASRATSPRTRAPSSSRLTARVRTGSGSCWQSRWTARRALAASSPVVKGAVIGQAPGGEALLPGRRQRWWHGRPASQCFDGWKRFEGQRGLGDELSKGVPALKTEPALAHRLLDNRAGRLAQPPRVGRRRVGLSRDLAHSLRRPLPLYVTEEGGLAGHRRFDLGGHAPQAIEEGPYVGLTGAAGGPVRERHRHGNVEPERRVLERL